MPDYDYDEFDRRDREYQAEQAASNEAMSDDSGEEKLKSKDQVDITTEEIEFEEISTSFED